MSTNEDMFDALHATDRLRMQRTPLFDRPRPRTRAVPAADRWRGMMLGLAIGDALGNTSESQLPENRHRRHGTILDYLPNRHAGGRRVGLPSDDTQMAFWTLEHLNAERRLEPDRLARIFATRTIFGMGATVREFRAAHDEGRNWPEAAPRSAGNGALMRIAPVVLPHLGRDDPGLHRDAALAGAITHNDPASIAACVAFTAMLEELLQRNGAPEPAWWVQTYAGLALPIEGEAVYAPRGGRHTAYAGTVAGFVAQHVPSLLAGTKSVVEAGSELYSGAFLLETVPMVLLILARHAHDPEEAIVRAVNDTRDNDTIAAIVGAAVGALHGEKALPRRWRDGLLGRTMAGDDGQVFRLLDEAEGWVGKGSGT